MLKKKKIKKKIPRRAQEGTHSPHHFANFLQNTEINVIDGN